MKGAHMRSCSQIRSYGTPLAYREGPSLIQLVADASNPRTLTERAGSTSTKRMRCPTTVATNSHAGGRHSTPSSTAIQDPLISTIDPAHSVRPTSDIA